MHHHFLSLPIGFQSSTCYATVQCLIVIGNEREKELAIIKNPLLNS